MSKKITNAVPSEIVVSKQIGYKDYFKLAVLYVIAGKNKPVIREATDGEKLTLKDENVINMIREAVPGHESYIMDLVIRTNVHEAIIDDMNLTVTQKVVSTADSRSQFVRSAS